MRRITTLLLISLSTASLAAEDESYNAAMNYASLDVQQDNADARQVSATLSIALGNHFWVQGSGGQISNDATSATLGDLRQAGAGFGFNLEHLQLGVRLNQTRNDDRYRQRDVNASLDWLTDRFSAGLGLTQRSTDNSIDTVRDFPTLGLTSVALHVDEKLTGNGMGLHASLEVTDSLTLSLGGMNYNYDSDYQLSSSSNPLLIRRLLAQHPTLPRLLYLNDSGVTRSLALLDNSFNVGASYVFDSFSLSANYFHDQALDNGGDSDTFMVNAMVLLGDHWMLSPMLGQSQSDFGDAVSCGGLSLSYNW